MSLTTDPTDPRLGHGGNTEPTKQNEAYLVLSAEELKKGFVRPVRTTYTHLSCKTDTTMNQAIAETYAANPGFYSHTYCVHCQKHLPVLEFVWKGTNDLVGS